LVVNTSGSRRQTVCPPSQYVPCVRNVVVTAIVVNGTALWENNYVTVNVQQQASAAVGVASVYSVLMNSG